MKQPITYLSQAVRGKLTTYMIHQKGGSYYEKKCTHFCGKRVLSRAETNETIMRMIHSSEPFMVCRFGAIELATVKTFDFELKSKYQGQLGRAHLFAGVFPEEPMIGSKFKDLMLDSIPYADLIGIWPQPFEEYYLNKFGNDELNFTWMKNLEPWMYPENPWSSALANKKVLVIHPFVQSIASQYAKREALFPNSQILPEFDLKVLKSVQTAAGGEDNRFSTWFEAFEWMKNQINSIDYDIAILGCGAYGFPLAAEIKKSGKQAIHIGGATQLLFGITGGRWDQDESMKPFINDAWCRPSEEEKPKDAKKVENGCYW